MVYRTIIDVILHLFIICNDLWCQLPFFSQTFRHNGSAVFGTMPPMCRSCPDVNKLRGMETTILGQHRPFMSIKSFVQHSGWQEMVSLCSLIRLIGVCADRDQPEFLCSRSDSRHLEVHVATAGGWLTRYRPREVRNSIYRYRKIHIDYRSKFLYRFISPISIIYGNTITIHIWQVSSQLSCGNTCPIWMWFKLSNRHFFKSELSPIREINDHTCYNPNSKVVNFHCFCLVVYKSSKHDIQSIDIFMLGSAYMDWV